MSFGRKKTTSNYDNKVQATLQPANFYSPYGNLVNGTYTPVQTPAQVQARDLTSNELLGVLQNIPTQYDVNQAYDNPFYQTLDSLYRRPIATQQAQDEQNLNNELSAQNQLGSSYDAYSRDLLARRYDTTYQQADNQARLGAANAYQQSLSNSLATLGALRNDQNSALNAALLPAQIGLSNRQASAPLQETLASYYGNRLNSDLEYQSSLGGVAPAVGAAAGAFVKSFI